MGFIIYIFFHCLFILLSYVSWQISSNSFGIVLILYKGCIIFHHMLHQNYFSIFSVDKYSFKNTFVDIVVAFRRE